MTSATIRLSPRGQFTLPIEIRRLIQAEEFTVSLRSGAIQMRPTHHSRPAKKTKVDELLLVAQQTLDFWDNDADTVWDQL